ncbi:hypothetical protein LINGRAHAP2_LOCUS30456, partial [Linum grandiflorum]
MERYRCALMLRRLLCGDRNRHRVGDVFTNEDGLYVWRNPSMRQPRHCRR